MKTFSLFLVFFVISILQTSIWPLEFILVLLFLLSLISLQKEVMLWSFLAGLLLDIFSHTVLGINAAFFLIVFFLFMFYKQFIQFPTLGKTIVLQYLFFTPFIVFSFFLSQVLKRSFSLGQVSFAVPIWPLILSFLLFLIFYPLFVYLSFKSKVSQQLELKV